MRALFQETGVDVGVTSKAWDGMDTGQRLASSFFGDDIGDRVNSEGDLQPGDLIGFERTYGSWGKGVQTHVGIYAGNGEMYDHSSKHGLIRRPVSTFAGKFLYGVRPKAYGGEAQGQAGQPPVQQAAMPTPVQPIALPPTTFSPEAAGLGLFGADQQGKVKPLHDSGSVARQLTRGDAFDGGEGASLDTGKRFAGSTSVREQLLDYANSGAAADDPSPPRLLPRRQSAPTPLALQPAKVPPIRGLAAQS